MTINTHWFSSGAGAYNFIAGWIRMYDGLTPQYYVQHGSDQWYTRFACVVDDFGDLIPVRKDGKPI